MHLIMMYFTNIFIIRMTRYANTIKMELRNKKIHMNFFKFLID